MTIPQPKRYTTQLGGRELVLETGKYAKQVSGSVTVRYGDTLVLVTAQMGGASPMDFLPLTVEYEERHYAIGKIPGSFMRREGRPGNQAILNARITDRQIRPLFPKGLRNEVQIIITVLAADQENDPAPLAAVGASAALMMSDIPWDGPTACVSVGYMNGDYVLNPTLQQLEESALELTVAGTRDAVLMVEGGAAELSEDVMVGAIEFAQREMAGVFSIIEQMRKDVGEPKASFEPAVELSPDDVEMMVREAQEAGLRDALLTKGKHDRSARMKELRNGILERLVPDPEAEGAGERLRELKGAFSKAEQRELRRMVLEENLRSDGRSPEDIRPIWIEVGPLPTAHGSAVFTRGETQVLGVTTLGTGKDNRLVDDLGLENSEEFMLHYNFPPFSTGEAKRLRGTSRRELGHGNLARRSLERMVPDQETFPYVIRVVAETFESNGSSSMASVCASSLSMMDAGVPLKKPVAGIAMGLVKEDDYKILSDILGSEDALGDMDFKVTGTRDGVTALQMDIKIKGITPQIMQAALEQAKAGRLHILGLMDEALGAPRQEVSERAQRIMTVQIPTEKSARSSGRAASKSVNWKPTARRSTSPRTVWSASTAKIPRPRNGSRRKSKVSPPPPRWARSMRVKSAKTLDFGAFVTLFPGTDGLAAHFADRRRARREC